ncbi:MAG TPA: cytochrome P450 [Streptosporangiaceae bacterium]
MPAVTLASLDYEQFNRELRADPLGTLTRLRGEGRVCVIPIHEAQRLIVAFDPKVAVAALAHGSRHHRELLRELLGPGLFVVASGEQWRRRRDLLRPMFTPAAVADLHGLVADAAEDFVHRYLIPRAGTELDVSKTLQRLSVEVILRLVEPAIAAELERLSDALIAAVDYLDRRLFDSTRVMDGEEVAFAAHKETLQEFIGRRAEKWAGAVGDQGLLARLTVALSANTRDEDPGQVLTQEIMSVFVAGVETMGALLTWVFFNLAGSEDALRRATDEAIAADLGKPDALPAYIRAVIEESLRLYPPAWALFRRIDESLNLSGVQFQPGDFAVVPTFAMHRDPELWADADEFCPERFLGGRPPAQQYLPFGAGPHQCLGRQFSLLEAVIATTTILRHGRFAFTTDRVASRLRPAIALEPDPHPRAVFAGYDGIAGRSAGCRDRDGAAG